MSPRKSYVSCLLILSDLTACSTVLHTPIRSCILINSLLILPRLPPLPPALADPMCGSGTFLIEAALMATNTAPGSFRRWWPFTQVRAGRVPTGWAGAGSAAYPWLILWCRLACKPLAESRRGC